MSHRKVLSQGNIPFSWEESPGVTSKKYLHKQWPEPPSPPLPQPEALHVIKTIPPPPPLAVQSTQPSRSTSMRGLWREEDPFLVAFKECTKGSGGGGDAGYNVDTKGYSGGKRKNFFGFKVRKSKFVLSCKNSVDVRDDSLVRVPLNLPPIPRKRYGGLAN